MIVFDMRWFLYTRRSNDDLYHLSLVIIKEGTGASFRNAATLFSLARAKWTSPDRVSQMLLEIENSSLLFSFREYWTMMKREEKEVYCLLTTAAAVRLSPLRHLQRSSRGISYRKSHGPIRWHHVLARTTAKLIHPCLRTITPFLVLLCT